MAPDPSPKLVVKSELVDIVIPVLFPEVTGPSLSPVRVTKTFVEAATTAVESVMTIAVGDGGAEVPFGSQGDVEKKPECTTCRVPAGQENLKLMNTAPALPASGLQVGGMVCPAPIPQPPLPPPPYPLWPLPLLPNFGFEQAL
jgi:hypothetical protein